MQESQLVNSESASLPQFSLQPSNSAEATQSGTAANFTVGMHHDAAVDERLYQLQIKHPADHSVGALMEKGQDQFLRHISNSDREKLPVRGAITPDSVALAGLLLEGAELLCDAVKASKEPIATRASDRSQNQTEFIGVITPSSEAVVAGLFEGAGLLCNAISATRKFVAGQAHNPRQDKTEVTDKGNTKGNVGRRILKFFAGLSCAGAGIKVQTSDMESVPDQGWLPPETDPGGEDGFSEVSESIEPFDNHDKPVAHEDYLSPENKKQQFQQTMQDLQSKALNPDTGQLVINLTQPATITADAFVQRSAEIFAVQTLHFAKAGKLPLLQTAARAALTRFADEFADLHQSALQPRLQLKLKLIQHMQLLLGLNETAELPATVPTFDEHKLLKHFEIAAMLRLTPVSIAEEGRKFPEWEPLFPDYELGGNSPLTLYCKAGIEFSVTGSKDDRFDLSTIIYFMPFLPPHLIFPALQQALANTEDADVIIKYLKKLPVILKNIGNYKDNDDNVRVVLEQCFHCLFERLFREDMQARTIEWINNECDAATLAHLRTCKAPEAIAECILLKEMAQNLRESEKSRDGVLALPTQKYVQLLTGVPHRQLSPSEGGVSEDVVVSAFSEKDLAAIVRTVVIPYTVLIAEMVEPNFGDPKYRAQLYAAMYNIGLRYDKCVDKEITLIENGLNQIESKPNNPFQHLAQGFWAMYTQAPGLADKLSLTGTEDQQVSARRFKAHLFEQSLTVLVSSLPRLLSDEKSEEGWYKENKKNVLNYNSLLKATRRCCFLAQCSDQASFQLRELVLDSIREVTYLGEDSVSLPLVWNRMKAVCMIACTFPRVTLNSTSLPEPEKTALEPRQNFISTRGEQYIEILCLIFKKSRLLPSKEFNSALEEFDQLTSLATAEKCKFGSEFLDEFDGRLQKLRAKIK